MNRLQVETQTVHTRYRKTESGESGSVICSLERRDRLGLNRRNDESALFVADLGIDRYEDGSNLSKAESRGGFGADRLLTERGAT
jgi:hypothetical protein